MIFSRIESEGLAHYSYLIAHNGEAIVIDPRRDCDEYLSMAVGQGFRITNILETHRNEDYLVGSRELASLTGAEIHHADSQLDYRYGQPVKEGDSWHAGRLKISALHTPGHTPGHMSYVLHDPGGNPWAVFTGDALFAGDVGRTDLLGEDRARKNAEQLYDSIFSKILPLGDGVLVCPAHGSGSACGSSIAERKWTTVGLERRHNPKLQVKDRNEFVNKAGAKLEFPPYFKKMEEFNLNPPLMRTARPLPMSPGLFEAHAAESFVLDSRTELAFASAHVPGSLSIWREGIPGFAGWFVPYDKSLLLVSDGEYPEQEIRMLSRIGLDNISGFLSGGMLSWNMSGKKTGSVDTLSVTEMCSRLDRESGGNLLDVRSSGEIAHSGKIRNATHIHITQLPGRLKEVPEENLHIFCGSGLRSMAAASYLKKEKNLDSSVILGGTSAWDSATCPIELMK
ncbi:MBL fold metallo-hydrolase [Candidatus Micrarchaeota archaeon]|nr:MBL fold metallo-hydrolase [Candidatus Micrarchaeota archaeon]